MNPDHRPSLAPGALPAAPPVAPPQAAALPPFAQQQPLDPATILPAMQPPPAASGVLPSAPLPQPLAPAAALPPPFAQQQPLAPAAALPPAQQQSLAPAATLPAFAQAPAVPAMQPPLATGGVLPSAPLPQPFAPAEAMVDRKIFTRPFVIILLISSLLVLVAGVFFWGYIRT